MESVSAVRSSRDCRAKEANCNRGDGATGELRPPSAFEKPAVGFAVAYTCRRLHGAITPWRRP
eukprot:scaffold27829_cov32-Phaeocystis_antarctica.AAC.1